MNQAEQDMLTLLKQTKKVRKLQIEYFRTRSRDVLTQSKYQESILDTLLQDLYKRYPDPEVPVQTQITFNH